MEVMQLMGTLRQQQYRLEFETQITPNHFNEISVVLPISRFADPLKRRRMSERFIHLMINKVIRDKKNKLWTKA